MNIREFLRLFRKANEYYQQNHIRSLKKVFADVDLSFTGKFLLHASSDKINSPTTTRTKDDETRFIFVKFKSSQYRGF